MMITFKKPDEVIFNRIDLIKAILNHTNTPKKEYKITIRNQSKSCVNISNAATVWLRDVCIRLELWRKRGWISVF